MLHSLSVIIPSRNREVILAKTLDSLIPLATKFHLEIIVLNDGEKDIQLLPTHTKDFIRIIKNTKKGNASCARNLGAKNAKHDLLLFIDDDIIVNEGNVEFAFKFYQEDSKRLLNFNWTYPEVLIEKCKESPFGRFLLKQELFQMKGWRKQLAWKDNEIIEVEAVASFFLMINKADYFSIEGFNEEFPFAGGEDIDFSRRIQQKGFKFYLNSMLKVYHNEEDRIIPKNWLERKYRSGITFAVASNMGYPEYYKTYTTKDKIIYAIISLAKPFTFWYVVINRGPKFLDRLYEKFLQVFLYHSLQKGWRTGIKEHIL